MELFDVRPDGGPSSGEGSPNNALKYFAKYLLEEAEVCLGEVAGPCLPLSHGVSVALE